MRANAKPTASSTANVHSGQRVITASGVNATVAFVDARGVVYATGPYDCVPVPVIVRYDAWGGEHDLSVPESRAESTRPGRHRKGHVGALRGPALRIAA